MLAARTDTCATILPACVSREDRLEAALAAVQSTQAHLDAYPDVEAMVVLMGHPGWVGPPRPAGLPLVLIAPNATEPESANPDDPSMLQVVGFDATVPRAIAEFVRGGVA